MSRFVLAVLTAALCLATRAAAQDVPPPAGAEGEMVVMYTVLGQLGTSSSEPLSPPADLVDRLVREPQLARLEIGPPLGSALRATFVFPHYERFRAWYMSPSTRDLLRVLGTRLGEPLYRLDVLRPEMADYLRFNPGA